VQTPDRPTRPQAVCLSSPWLGATSWGVRCKPPRECRPTSGACRRKLWRIFGPACIPGVCTPGCMISPLRGFREAAFGRIRRHERRNKNQQSIQAKGSDSRPTFHHRSGSPGG
jgi:hypothetical protein